MHSGHSGYMQLGALHMFVIEYSGWDGQGMGTKPGAQLVFIEVISPQPLFVDTLDSNIQIYIKFHPNEESEDLSK